MNNQEILELSRGVLDALYLFTAFFAGLYLGYIFGRKDEHDDNF